MNKMYVTFHFPGDGWGKTNKWAIECKDYDMALEVASDVYSLDGVNYLRINKSGKLSKGYKIIQYDNGKYISVI